MATLTQEQIDKRNEKRREMTKAKNDLYDFTQSALFASLPDDVKSAIDKVAQKKGAPRDGNGRQTIADFFKSLFPSIGSRLDEFELFKKTKMGRGEMKKKIHYNIKNAAPEDVYWIRLDQDQEAWILDQIGGDCPENWTDQDKPVYRKAA